MQQYYRFADVYGRSNYGSGEYSCTTKVNCVANASGSSSGLANTGTYVLMFVSLACLLIFIAMLVRIWRRPKLQTQEVQVEEPNQQPRQDS